MTKKELNIPIQAEKEISDFKSFAFKGQMIGMAVAMLLGSAFEKVVKAISQNILMPFSNYFLKFTNGDWRNFVWQPIDGMKLEIGSFAGTSVDFFIVSLILYVIYVKLVKKYIIHEKAMKICPNCCTSIAPSCKRCPACTSWLDSVEHLK
jgi:large conductance mechanosensitive channel